MVESENKIEQFYLQVLSVLSANWLVEHLVTHLPDSRSAKELPDKGHVVTQILFTSYANILGDNGHEDTHFISKLLA